MAAPRKLIPIANKLCSQDAVSLFYATYVFFEIPFSMLLKKLRPNRLIGALIIGFSASIISAGFIKNAAGLYITRLLLGVFESGLFPYDTPHLFKIITNILQLPHRASDNFL